MNFKKVILLILAFAVTLNMCFVCSAQDGLAFSAERFEIKNARVIISGKTEKSGDTVTVIVKNKESKNIFLLDETVSGKDKNFAFDLKMPDSMKGVIAEGVFAVTIASNDVVITGDKYEFEFAGSAARSKIVEAVKNNPESIRQIIENDENGIVLKTIGIAKDDFEKLSSDAQKDGVISFFKDNADIENLTEETFCSGFNAAVYAMYIKYGSAAFALDKLNYSYDGKTFSQISDVNMKNYIVNSINSKSYRNEGEIESDYKFYYGVYVLNNAKATDISDVLESHKSALKIADTDEYKSFASLDGESLTKAERALAQYIEKSAITTVEKIKSALSSAYASATYEEPSAPSKGGSSSKGGGSSVSFNTNIPETKPDGDLPQTERKFSDLNSVSWAEDAIEKLADLKIVSGDGDGRFLPDNSVKREEFIKMLVLALDIYDENAECGFDDVNSGDWHYKYIASALQSGIVRGISQSSFGTGEYLKREDVAVMLDRCVNLKNENDSKFAFDDDGEISEYAKTAVYKLYANGIINGVSEKTFAPKESCTRAMAAKLIYSSIIENTGGDK